MLPTTAVLSQWDTTNKPSAVCIFQQQLRYDVQHWALVLIFIINNSNQPLYRQTEHKSPAIAKLIDVGQNLPLHQAITHGLRLLLRRIQCSPKFCPTARFHHKCAAPFIQMYLGSPWQTFLLHGVCKMAHLRCCSHVLLKRTQPQKCFTFIS